MLTTAELVSEIKLDYAPEWDRERLVDFVRRTQLRLCNQDSRLMVFWNRSDDTFPVPYLKTTDGVLNYEIGDDGTGSTNLVDSDGNDVDLEITLEGTAYPILARRVRSVFVYRFRWIGPDVSAALGNSWSYDRSWIYDHSADPKYGGVEFVPDDMRGTKNAQVTFLENPGTTTDKFHVLFYHTPADVLSDTIPLTVDGDQWHQALIDGAVGIVEDIESGRSTRLERFEKYWMKKFLNHNADITKHYRPTQMRVRGAG